MVKTERAGKREMKDYKESETVLERKKDKSERERESMFPLLKKQPLLAIPEQKSIWKKVMVSCSDGDGF